eukprot:scaffold2551_cov113-Cylindrotheca_fusiformis.AAC.21
MPESKGQWKSAVDPRSGKTYYYHTVTRETQWRKPLELASDAEKRKMAEKEAKQKDFFASMEANILNSLSQGVLPGSSQESEVERLASRKISVRGERPELERTISAMDESVLRDLIRRQPSIHQPKKVESIQSTVSSLGGFESIIRQPSRLASVSEMFSDIPDEESNDHSDDNALHMSLGSGFGLDWEETAALKKLGAIAKEMTDSEDDKPSDMPQEISLKGKDLSKMKTAPMPSRSTRSKSDSGSMFQKAKNIGGRELEFDSDSDDDDDDQDAVRPVTRRNTCGTMYVKTTMSAPDIDATIKCICGVFRSHILTSECIDPETNSEFEVFDDNRDSSVPTPKTPSLDEVTKFYRDIFLKAQMESDTLIMSLIYVERLIKVTKGALRPRPSNWRSLIFSCMILSSKVWDDLSMWNVDFSQSCPKGVSFPLQRINELELNILKALGFQVKVPASEYAKYYFLLRSMLIKSGLGGDEMSNPLDVEGARRLQQISSQFEDLSMTKEKTRTSFEKGNRAQSLNPNLLSNSSKERKSVPKLGLEHVVEM